MRRVRLARLYESQLRFAGERVMSEGALTADEITVDQMLGVAQWLERVSVREVLKEVNSIAKDRTDAFWSGHSTACEEVLHRLAVLWGKTNDPEWKLL